MTPDRDKPRCSHPTRTGKPCRAQVVRGSDPPVCAVHSRRAVPPRARGDGRCTAVTPDGERCRAWALRGSDPPLCVFHADPEHVSGETHARVAEAVEPGLVPVSGPALAAPAGRRCTAVRKDGERCRLWAIRGTDPPRCSAHADRLFRLPSPPPDEDRCCYRTKRGERCRHWAVRGSNPPACSIHAGLARSPMTLRPGETGCSFRNYRGQPCRARALPGSDPPACAVHAGLWHPEETSRGNVNAWKHGAYSMHLFDGLAELYERTVDDYLAGEIAVVRELAHRLARVQGEAARLYKEGSMSTNAFASITEVAFRAFRRLADLLLQDHKLRKADAQSRKLREYVQRIVDDLDKKEKGEPL